MPSEWEEVFDIAGVCCDRGLVQTLAVGRFGKAEKILLYQGLHYKGVHFFFPRVPPYIVEQNCII